MDAFTKPLQLANYLASKQEAKLEAPYDILNVIAHKSMRGIEKIGCKELTKFSAQETVHQLQNTWLQAELKK